MKNFRVVSSIVQFVAAERCEVRPDRIAFCLSEIVVKSYHRSEVRLVEEFDRAMNPKAVLYPPTIAHGFVP